MRTSSTPQSPALASHQASVTRSSGGFRYAPAAASVTPRGGRTFPTNTLALGFAKRHISRTHVSVTAASFSFSPGSTYAQMTASNRCGSTQVRLSESPTAKLPQGSSMRHSSMAFIETSLPATSKATSSNSYRPERNQPSPTADSKTVAPSSIPKSSATAFTKPSTYRRYVTPQLPDPCASPSYHCTTLRNWGAVAQCVCCQAHCLINFGGGGE
mmetsp:Transcript_7774/g.19262  ORF Transcript_7774/g.19262 Transcript_7774/m.19262 type:complete len:214 (-) Transcript_7774:252-893(-)